MHTFLWVLGIIAFVVILSFLFGRNEATEEVVVVEPTPVKKARKSSKKSSK